jgi:hypothetical protein
MAILRIAVESEDEPEMVRIPEKVEYRLQIVVQPLFHVLMQMMALCFEKRQIVSHVDAVERHP